MKMVRILAYILVVAGMILDQISTKIVLQSPNFHETNPHAAVMMSLGLWLPIDILLTILSVALPEFAIRHFTFQSRKALIAYPFTLGIIRLAAGLWNLHWLL